MHPRDHGEPYEGYSEAARTGFVRRGRRFTPPGSTLPRAELPPTPPLPARASGRSVQLGDVVAELTPRQAVVWLLNLDTMVSLYESTTEQRLGADSRERLVRELREHHPTPLGGWRLAKHTSIADSCVPLPHVLTYVCPQSGSAA